MTMLTSSERRRLVDLSRQVRAVDARFADGLRRGRPRAPREYRLRRLAIALVALGMLAVLAVGGILIANADAAGVLLIWPAMIATAWALSRLRRMTND